MLGSGHYTLDMETKLRLKGPELLARIETSPIFWEILLREKVIQDIDTYASVGSRMNQVSMLLQHIRRGSPNIHYRGLLVALSETNQAVIVKDVLKDDITNYPSEDVTTDASDGSEEDSKQKLRKLLASYQKRRSHVKRCPWDQHKLLEVDQVFQPLVFEVREMTYMGVEKTSGSVTSLFASRETLSSTSDSGDLSFHGLLEEGARICLSGARGCGKSTLLTKIETDWANHQGVSQEYDLLFHIDCEQLRFDEDLISYIQRCNLPNLKCADEQLLNNHLGKGSDGINMLFLLDNADQLKMDKNTFANNYIQNLLSGKSFPYSCVIATSRLQNWSSQTPNDVVFDKNIIIKGFSEEGLYEYIKRFTDSTESRQTYDRLIKMLNEPQVFSLLRYPLHINFLIFAASGSPVHGRTELYTHVLRALLSQSQGNITALDDAMKMLYNKRELRMEVLPELGFVIAAGEVAFANMIGNDFDIAEGCRTEYYQTAVNVGLLAIEKTDRDQNSTEVYVVQHETLTEYLTTIYLASLAEPASGDSDNKMRKKGGIRRAMRMRSVDLLTEKLEILTESMSDNPQLTGMVNILVFSASISIELFQAIIKHSVSKLKDDCYDELRSTREWHSTVGNQKFQAMNSIMDAFYVAYTEMPKIWRERAGHVFRILTNKCFVTVATKHSIPMAMHLVEDLSPKMLSGIKGVLLVYWDGQGFPALLQQLLKKCCNIKYLHILFYLDLPRTIPKDYSDFKSVPLPYGEKVVLHQILHGGQKVLDLYGVPLHNISTRALQDVHNLHSLCLRDAKLREEDGGSLAEFIKGQPKLEVLNLHNNPKLQQGLRSVIAVLHQNQRLRTLDLSRTGLTNEAWSDLQDRFSDLKHLEFLELSMNLNLGLGIKCKNPSLDEIKNLKELHMRDCGLDLPSLNKCLESISTVSSLKVLDILDNNLDLDDSSCELLPFVKSCTRVLHLFIHGNTFSQEWLSDLVANKKHPNVDAERDPKRRRLETRFVNEVCMYVGRSIKSAASGKTVSLYFLDENENENGPDDARYMSS